MEYKYINQEVIIIEFQRCKSSKDWWKILRDLEIIRDWTWSQINKEAEKDEDLTRRKKSKKICNFFKNCKC